MSQKKMIKTAIMLQNKSILLNTNQLNFINNEVSTFIKLLILSQTQV